jgi:hypothetical protein
MLLCSICLKRKEKKREGKEKKTAQHEHGLGVKFQVAAGTG